MTRSYVADDFETIRSRIEELRRDKTSEHSASAGGTRTSSEMLSVHERQVRLDLKSVEPFHLGMHRPEMTEFYFGKLWRLQAQAREATTRVHARSATRRSPSSVAGNAAKPSHDPA